MPGVLFCNRKINSARARLLDMALPGVGIPLDCAAPGGGAAIFFGGNAPQAPAGSLGRDRDGKLAVLGWLELADPVIAMTEVVDASGALALALLQASREFDVWPVRKLNLRANCRPSLGETLVTSWSGPREIAAGDLDGDGIDEIALAGPGMTSLNAMAEDGEYRESVFMFAERHRHLNFVDFDGDGRAHLMVDWDGVLTLLGPAAAEADDAQLP